jgi:hypothetical protein
MKSSSRIRIITLILAAVVTLYGERGHSQGPSISKTPVVAAINRLSLSFEPNVGQADKAVRFLARGAGYSVLLADNETMLEPAGIRMRLVNANPHATPIGVDELRGKTNYLKGNDPSKWRTNMSTFGRVKYDEVYPGVDLAYYGRDGELEFDFIVKPGADPRAIRMRFEGMSHISIDSEHGDLILRTASGDVRMQSPLMYQSVTGSESKERVPGGFVLKGDNQVVFEPSAYDPSRPLVIDPVVSYSTYLGGSTAQASSVGRSIAVFTDPATGHVNAYVAGGTCTSDFPTVNALKGTFGGGGGGEGACDAFVTRLDPSASGAASVVYSTYFGGSGRDIAFGIAVDSSGNAYFTGDTDSRDFPLVNAYQPVFRARGQTAYLSKLSADGSTVLYSTYFGGSNGEGGGAVALDALGRAYIAGSTVSGDMPTLNPYHTARAGDAFIAAFDTTQAGAASLFYATNIGGTNDIDGADSILAIAVDASGAIHVAGVTTAIDYPTINGVQSTPADNGHDGAFYSKLNPSASGAAQLVYSTYLGGVSGLSGSYRDTIYGLALDSSGNAYLAGTAYSAWYPVTVGAYQTTLVTNPSGFVTKIDPSKAGPASLVYSTLLSGPSLGDAWTRIFGLAVDAFGSAYVTGDCGSAFPLLNPFQPAFGGAADAFITKINPAGSGLVYSSVLGGSDLEKGLAIAVDAAGSAYVTGFSASTDFPTTANAFQTAFAGVSGATYDAFVTKIPSTDIPVSAGSNVTVHNQSATLSFDSVTTSGYVDVSPIADPAAAGDIPGGFAISNLVAYQVTPSASLIFSGAVTTCFVVSGVNDPTEFASLRVLHSENGALVDRTSSQDFLTRTLCAVTNSFSPFYVARIGNRMKSLFDQTRAYRAGSTIPIRIQMWNRTGVNISSPSLLLTTRKLTPIGSSTSALVIDAGNSNPDSTFRYDATIAGYVFNLSTKGLPSGRYVLSFWAGADRAFFYDVTFEVR